MFTIYVFFLFSTYCNMILSLLGSTGQILSKLSFSQYHANIATEKCNFNMYRLNLTKVFSYFAFDYLQNETNLNFVIFCQREVNVLVCCPAMPFKQSYQRSSVYATNHYLQTTQLLTPLSLNQNHLWEILVCEGEKEQGRNRRKMFGTND